MKTILGALVGFAIGAGGIYLLEQGKFTNLQSSMSALEAQLSDVTTKADASAAEFAKLQESGKAMEAEMADIKAKADAAVTDMKAALQAKTDEATALQAKVTELEAALSAARTETSQ
jgi:predicted  nucleic acid-binding Zn-ribbon protein